MAAKVLSTEEYFRKGGTPETIISFLSRNGPANCFMLGNLRNMGFETGKKQELLLAVDGKDGGAVPGITAVLMAHFTNALLYFPSTSTGSAADSPALPLLPRLLSWIRSGRVNRINGLASCMDDAADYLRSADEGIGIRKRRMQLAVYESDLPRPPLQPEGEPAPLPEGVYLEKAEGPEWELLDRIMDEKEHIEEFVTSPGARETFRNSHLHGGARSLALVNSQGRVLAAASSTAENPSTAMIVGVFTVEGCRNRGYSRRLMDLLIESLKQDSLMPVLFYENPVAEKIYKGMGFQDREDYDLLHFQLDEAQDSPA
ncbi:GNAT family N-acetyltransferase [Salinispira pacifica]|uniref:Acetyltransferase n=1 Tax=Salinispira pacifica TaxID=1307761 RepID=V5WJ03_9SPIO|nr:GNAT family N-acetyltransferase [Salinispira pacifica]AHC15773.1 Acetyltransferase [Salinispira pacifica]